MVANFRPRDSDGVIIRTNEEIMASLGSHVPESHRLLPFAETMRLLEEAQRVGFENMENARTQRMRMNDTWQRRRDRERQRRYRARLKEMRRG